MVLCIARDFLAALVLMSCVTEGIRIEYKIDVVTADIAWAGTDSSIYIELFGKKGRTNSHNLDSAGNDFERGRTNNFVINDKDIGDLECIQLTIDGRDGWLFESITVVYGPHGSRHTVENTASWLDDYNILKLCNIKAATQYSIAMETSTYSWSGTDSKIFITLRGSAGTTAERQLDNRGLNDFQKGHTSNFVINDKDIGYLRCISLRIDGTDGYRAKTITVVNEARGTTSSTDVDEWLDDNKRLEFCDIRQGTEYKIALKTSTRSWAGTDSGIYVILKGSNGNTKEHVLDTHNHDDFRKGNTDTYVFYDQSVGSLDCILFRNNGGDRWLVDTIKVEIGAYEYSTTNRNIAWLNGYETIKFCNLHVEY